MKKRGRIVLAATLLLCFIALFTTCKNNIGLGGSIDINPPMIKNDSMYPPNNAIIKGAFTLAVKADDDTGVNAVTAVITTADAHNTQISIGKAFLVKPSSNDGYWTLRIDPKGEYPISDGAYKVEIQVEDTAGKVSTVTSAFTIDNTPPLLILNRPSTAAAGASDPNADIFGDKFLLKGQLYDRSDVERLTITARDASGNTKGSPAVLYSVPQSLNVTVDSFFSSTAAPSFYRSVYGNEISKGKQQYSYTITVSDSAREYTDPTKRAGTGEGNSTSTYYLYNDLYQMLNESRYKPADIYAIMQAGIYGTGLSIAPPPPPRGKFMDI